MKQYRITKTTTIVKTETTIVRAVNSEDAIKRGTENSTSFADARTNCIIDCSAIPLYGTSDIEAKNENT